MSRQKKKDQKRERLQRAARKREQLEERRTVRTADREKRRTAGMSWFQRLGLNDLFSGSPANRGQAWCILGVLLGVVIIAVHTVLGSILIVMLGWVLKLLAGEIAAADGMALAMQFARVCWYFAWIIFLPSFFGVFVFRYFEHVLEGEAFGRGQALDEPLEVAVSSYQTKDIKVHTDDVLRIGPTLRDRMFPLAFLGPPLLWYCLLAAFWFFVPSAYDFGDDATLTEWALPFALPLPFVIAGVALLTVPRTFTFDRKAKRLRIANFWQRRILLIDDVKSLQLVPGQPVQKGRRKRHRPQPTSYSTVQLNLVLENAEFPRVNISHDIACQSAVEIGQLLSQFLHVPFDNALAAQDNA